MLTRDYLEKNIESCLVCAQENFKDNPDVAHAQFYMAVGWMGALYKMITDDLNENHPQPTTGRQYNAYDDQTYLSLDRRKDKIGEVIGRMRVMNEPGETDDDKVFFVMSCKPMPNIHGVYSSRKDAVNALYYMRNEGGWKDAYLDIRYMDYPKLGRSA